MKINNKKISRRLFMKHGLVATAPILFASTVLPGMATKASASSSSLARKLKIVCVGGHPDDPESGCAGTLALYAALGHAVTIIYMTRGERGIKGKSMSEAAAIRTTECETSCKILGVKPVFAGQIDGETELTSARTEDFTKILLAEEPDIVFTHWPIDTHMDHQVASILTIRAQLNNPHFFHLYFYEVATGLQTLGFTPDTYVDVTTVLAKKKNAQYAHVSQRGDAIWREHDEMIANFRGREAGVGAAEAFIHGSRNYPQGKLPNLLFS